MYLLIFVCLCAKGLLAIGMQVEARANFHLWVLSFDFGF